MNFNNTFYIRPVNDHHFLLLLVDNHYCMSATTYERCLEKVTEFVKRYKNEVRMFKHLHTQEDLGKVGRVCEEERQQWYNEGGWREYSHDIRRAVKEGLEYNKDHSPIGAARKVLKTSPLKGNTPAPVVKKTVVHDSAPVIKTTPKILRKPKLSKVSI